MGRKISEGVINFAVYKNKTDFCGLASVKLPDIAYKTLIVSGAGINADVEITIPGVIESLTMGMDFINIQDEAYELLEPEPHRLELRVAQQIEDTVKGTVDVEGIKIIAVVVPKKLSGGQIAPASQANPSGEYAVKYYSMTKGSENVLEIDPMNSIFKVRGKDYLEKTRKVLGK